jgi:thioredoxin 1
MKTLHATSADEVQTAVATHPRLLVDWHKDDCPACRMLDRSLAVFATTPEARGLVLLKVRLEMVGEACFRTMGLRQTPTLTIHRDGAEAARLPGFQSPAQLAAATAAAWASPPA